MQLCNVDKINLQFNSLIQLKLVYCIGNYFAQDTCKSPQIRRVKMKHVQVITPSNSEYAAVQREN